MADFITPIQPLAFGAGGIEPTAKKTPGLGSQFADIFAEAVQNVRDTQANLENEQYKLVTGQIDDPHTVTIAAAEAGLSVDLLVALRNKAVEAYNELMRISM